MNQVDFSPSKSLTFHAMIHGMKEKCQGGRGTTSIPVAKIFHQGWTNCGIFAIIVRAGHADIAQLVERLIRNQQVMGPSPIIGSSFFRGVAQFGSAFGSGPKGRGFESRHFDARIFLEAEASGIFLLPCENANQKRCVPVHASGTQRSFDAICYLTSISKVPATIMTRPTADFLLSFS